MASAADNRLALRLFGSPVLMAGDELRALGRRARAMLAYLALSSPPRATRERLTGLFWPDRGDAQARASLRQCIVEIRNAIGDALTADREWVALSAGALVGDWFDLDAALGRADPVALAAALARIGAEPLVAGLEFGEAFDDWLRTSRAAIDARLATAVLQCVSAANGAGDPTAALALADAWLLREPIDEAVAAAAIAIEMGRNAAAAAQRRYRALEAALAREGMGAPGATVRAALQAPATAITPQPLAAAAIATIESITGRQAGGNARPGLAVLMFRHPPNDADQAYFAEGVAEDIIAGLNRSRLLRVTSRQSSLAYAAEGVATTRICADLGVRYLVRGHIRRMGGAVRVTAELIDGAEDQMVWSSRYDRPVSDIFAVQDEITAAIAGTIEPELLGREQQLAMRGNRDLGHWDLFIRGRHHYWLAGPVQYAEAASLFEQALALVPEDAPTLSMLAMTELGEVWAGTARDPAIMIRKAQDYAMRAIASDPRDAGAHHALGVVLSLTGQFDQAMAEQRRALELNPTNAQAIAELGRLHAFRGDVDAALACVDEALRYSPNDPHDWLWLRSRAVAFFIAGRHDDAVACARDACARRPDFFFLHFLVAACSATAGDIDNARIACAEGLRLNARYGLRALHAGHPFSQATDLEKFTEALRTAGWAGDQR